MSLQYRIYRNDAAGGPVDFSAAVDTTSSLAWSSPALTPPCDVTYLVRTYDTVSGLEDQNGDARVRIVLDGDGRDVTSLPAPPCGLSAVPTAGGGCQVSWVGDPFGTPPQGFRVYLFPAGAPSYSTPAATVASPRGSLTRVYTTTLAGLSDGVAYEVACRAWNATGEESNTTTAAVTGMAAGPSPVVSLTATAVP